MPHLFVEFLVCLAMTGGLAGVHLIGLLLLMRVTRHHIRHWKTRWVAFDRMAVPLTMILGLFVVHGLEVLTYAIVYMDLMGFGLEDGLFASLGAYTTVSLVPIPDGHPWRLVLAQEALVGFLLIGWSTAFLFSTLSRIMNTEENHPLPQGAIADEPPPQER